jgi:hypothetical protein
MANLSASCFMRVASTVKELRRSLFLSRPSAVAPPELLSCRQVADWETGISPIISVLPVVRPRFGDIYVTYQASLNPLLACGLSSVPPIWQIFSLSATTSA